MNNPIRFIDPTGMNPEEGGGGGEPIYGATLPEISIKASRSGNTNRDQSTERYGYRGDWKAYQKEFNLQGWDYDNYSSYYEAVHRADFNASVKRQDKEEEARIAIEKLMYWYGIVFPAVTTTIAPTQGRGFFRTSPSKFKFSSPSVAKGMTGKQTAIFLSEQGADGATAQLTMTNGKFFVGVSSGIRPFQLTDEMAGILMNAGRTGKGPLPPWFGGCAEVSAIQQARAAGYTWSQIRNASLEAYYIGTGNVKPFCAGCLNMLDRIPK